MRIIQGRVQVKCVSCTWCLRQDTFTGVTLKTSSTYQAHFGARATDTQTGALRLGAGVASTENRVEHEHRGLGVR